MDQSRLQQLLDRFPLLASTLEKLDAAGIPYAIGGSGCLFLLGNERLPDDVDIYLPNDRHDEADKIFGIESYTFTSTQENVRNSNPEGNHSVQLTSGLVLMINEKSYDLQLTPDVLAARLMLSHEGRAIALYPPEDVLLIKALLQRGKDVGKHDLEDIEKFTALYADLRLEYLQDRITTLGAEARVKNIFS